MSKPRKTPVPLPGSKSKSKAVSREFVSSDDDSSHELETQSTSTQQKARVQIAVHRPKANGVAKTTTKAAKKQPEIPKPKAKASASLKKPAPKNIEVEEQDESSDSSSESGEESGTDIKEAQKRQAEKTQNVGSDSESSSESSSEDSSEDTSEDSEEEATPASTSKTATSPPKSHAQAQTVEFQPAQPYAPPQGFQAISTNRASSSSATAALENLKGKQVWHITAPEGISLKILKELAMDKALNGEAILNQKGADYGLVLADDGESSSREVIIPRQNGYKTVSARISRTFDVRQFVNLPKLTSKQADENTGSEAAASITASSIREVRPQVRGLKMRCFPSGFGKHTPITLGDTDSEDDTPMAEPAGLAIPRGIHLPVRTEKRKHVDTNGDERVESPTKKHKKHRTPEELRKRDEKKAKKAKKQEKHSTKTKS